MFDSNKIRQVCDQKGITLKSLAEAIDKSPHGLNKMLNNNDFKISTIEKIAEILEVPVVTFFTSDQSYATKSTHPKIFLAFEVSGEQEDKVLKMVMGQEFINLLKK